MNKKRTYVLTSIIMIVSMVLAACGTTTPATSAPAATQEAPSGEATQAPASGDEVVTLNFWEGFVEGDTATLNTLIQKYWAPSHPNIKVVLAGNKRNADILTAMSGGDAPDIIMSESSEAITLWASQGAILDLTSAIEPYKAQLESDEVAAGLQWVIFDGKYYALPFVNYDLGLYYNKALFREAGLDPENPPRDIAELKDYAQKLTKVDASGNITQLGWLPINNELRAITFALNFGGKFYDPATNAPTLNDPNTIAAFQWDLDLANIYGLDKVVAFTTGFDMSGDNPFQLGKVAMYIDGCWQPQFFRQNTPDLDYGVAAVPYSDQKYAGATWVGTNPIAIPTASPHPQEAIEFAIWLSLNKDIAREFSSIISNIPQITSEMSTFTDDPETKFFADLSNTPNAVAWAPVPYAQQYLDEIASTIGDMYNKGVAPKDALDAAQQIVEEAARSYIK